MDELNRLIHELREELGMQTAEGERRERQAQEGLRINRRDEHNWVVESWSPPSEIKVGPKKGQMSEGAWKVAGYYSSLRFAALAMLDKGAGEAVESGREIIDALDEAEERVLAALKERS